MFYFYENETCLLLAHQLTSEKIIDIVEIPEGVYFLCGKAKPPGKKGVRASFASNMMFKLGRQDTKVNGCQILAR